MSAQLGCKGLVFLTGLICGLCTSPLLQRPLCKPKTQQQQQVNATATTSSSNVASEWQRPSKLSDSPIVITVTGAAGQIGYSIIFMIARGLMTGQHQKIELRLLDIPDTETFKPQRVLRGIAMELQDCAFDRITKVVCTDSYETAFKDCDVALLIGAKPRGKGQERADLLRLNASIFEGQGRALDRHAKKTVKVLVVGNPANTNALIAQQAAPSIPSNSFAAMTRLDQNRAVGFVADKLHTDTEKIQNVVIWGNHSSTQYPSINYASVAGQSVRQAINDDVWCDTTLVQQTQTRGAAIIDVLGKSSAASAANACVETMRDWLLGTKPSTFVSMAVLSSGEYGAPKNVIFSFPVECRNGEWEIVEGLRLTEFDKEKIRVTGEELLQEAKEAGAH